MKYVSQYSFEPSIIEENEYKVILKSNYPCKYNESKKLPLYLYNSKNSDKIFLFVHGLGTKNLKYLKWFPQAFSENGFNSALMILPYHFERTPSGKKSGEMFLDTTENSILRSRFEHAVVDILTSINYLKRRYKSKKVYLMGFSFGGMVSVIASAFSNDIASLSLCVTGGNFYYITWKSFATGVLRVQYEENSECTAKECRLKHGIAFEKYIQNLKEPSIELDTAPIACYEYDPLTFAKFVKSPTIMFRAVFDIFIPKNSSLELYNHLNVKKELHTIPTGHLTSYVMRRYIMKKTVNFFNPQSM